MPVSGEIRLIQTKYEEIFGARIRPNFSDYFNRRGATLGYRRATATPLFIEQYLDEPVEAVVARAFARRVERHDVVELGNFASDNALAMVELWGGGGERSCRRERSGGGDAHRALAADVPSDRVADPIAGTGAAGIPQRSPGCLGLLLRP